MSNDDYEIRYPIDAVNIKKFAELLGKTPSAVKDMAEDQKLPVIFLKDPTKPNARSERWIYLPEFNRIVREAYFNRPAEERDAWLKWLGL
ncbi:Cox family DNA-binding protein [Arsenophonus sp. PmNCSU2021_1]|uniref:Cox family DNA-binding protein n=1 Tax=Arsenophonus sp. PmNCSU2021_1 TaxID=3118989 RepID=UPI002FF24C30